ncbi:RluA family pseudouridine synthase [Brevibacillus marinus]|uniref:RluA family pseudouridine synthase n=1 Tax=Brevibacillus marinus TaxID=2496837 RepID=UPI000F84876A|nr:RluA family pseudouridine synthase [Brevibacillus marinus]
MIALYKEGEWLTGSVPEEVPAMPLGQLLREHWQLPRKLVHLLFQDKGVLVDGEPVNQQRMVRAGERLSLRVLPEPLGLAPLAGKLDLLYEDDHLLIVNKPAGCLLHPTQPGDTATLDHLVAGYFQQQGIAAKVRHIHRLDRDTSGAVLYAKHALAAALLDEQLRRRQISRRYLAFVLGQPKRQHGTIAVPIGRDRHHAVRRIVSRTGEPAVTHYRVQALFPAAALLACQLETGKTHQIRVHCRHIGHPLLGDVLYGGRSELINRVALHAASLSFFHPFGGRLVRVEADWPDDLVRLQARLRSET